MAEPTAVRTVGGGEHVVLCLHGWFGSATGWGWLLGHSMGGTAAARVLLEAPERVRVERSDRAAVADSLRAWAHTDFSELVRGDGRVTGTPVKVIVGEHDPALSADLMGSTWLAWHPDAELDVLPNAGHYAPEETPVALVTSVEEFLARRG